MNTAQISLIANGSFLSSSSFQAVLAVLILLAVCWVAFYVMSRLRDSNTEDEPLDQVVRKNFEEMRSEGYITDKEFRNINSLIEEKPRRLSLPRSNPSDNSSVEDSEQKSN